MAETGLTKAALDFWLKKKPMTQTALSKATGLSQNYISLLLNGKRDGSLESLQKLGKVFGVSVSEFLACRDLSLPEIEFVPKLKARPRAGTGGLETDGEAEGYYSFHSCFLRRKGGDKDSMRLFTVDGDSMEPTLHNGDLVMVNQKLTDISSGQIYLLRFENELMIKRLERRPAGEILIRSDNPTYDPITINPLNEGIDFQVFGRMVWLCREF